MWFHSPPQLFSEPFSLPFPTTLCPIPYWGYPHILRCVVFHRSMASFLEAALRADASSLSSFLAKRWDFMPISPLHAGNLSGLGWHNPWEFRCIAGLPCPEESFLVVFSCLLLFPLPFHNGSWVFEGGIHYMCSFRTEHSDISHSVFLGQQKVSVLVITCCKQKLL